MLRRIVGVLVGVVGVGCVVLALGAGSALAVAMPEVVTGAGGEVRVQSPTLYRATLNGTVNPQGVQLTDCHFEYVSEAAYEPFAPNPYAAGQSVPCVPAAGAIPADSEVHAVSAQVVGLAPSTTYHFRLQATTEGAAFGEDAVLATPPAPAPPSLEGAAAVNLTGSSADLQVRIGSHELDTTYRFEWGTSSAYGARVPVPDGDAGAGASAVLVSAHLSGLSANITYQWRVVASNASGTTTGLDQTFVYDTTGSGLPDGRGYEMVTPVQKNGSPIGLTPRALNDVQLGATEGGEPIFAENVYEYHEGHVYLISDGRDVTAATTIACQIASGFPERSSVCLIGVSGSGADVFFSTGDRLVPGDTDTQVDIYDARVCTASEPCVGSVAPPVSCQGEACHGTPVGAPSVAGAGSAVFSGPGNLAPPARAVVKHRAKRKAKHRAKRRPAHKRRAKKSGRGRSSRAGGR